MRRATPDPPSKWLLAAAEPYLRRFAAKHFSGVRIALDGHPAALEGPTVFYANHPSWWDPIVLLLLIRSHYPDWRFHGPIDAAGLERYPWLERLGLFAIEPDTPTGARHFLEIGATLLAQPRTGLALTAQGRFTDPRIRPALLKRGLAQLLRRNPAVGAIPIAIEYVFWNERLPEALVRCGQAPIVARGRPVDAVQLDLESALAREQDRLSAAAIARDPADFEPMITGRRGIGFWQDLPARLRSLVRGDFFDASHAAVERGAHPPARSRRS
jgi:hypothetical protein